jgi:hypothetical protein
MNAVIIKVSTSGDVPILNGEFVVLHTSMNTLTALGAREGQSRNYGAAG